MNKLKHLILLLLALVVTLPVNAQLSPARLVRPGFPLLPSVVYMTALRTSLYTQARWAGITSREQLTQEVARADFVRSIFRVYPEGDLGAHALSGFIFKTTYQGKEEIFGVVAQHAMPLTFGGGQLGESFTALVMQNDHTVNIPAEIVQMSAPSMPDMALVKFRPEDENLLTPLTLAEQDPTPGELLSLIGFGREELTFITDSPLLEKSLVSLRFPMAGDGWSGLCGSPLINSAGQVVGMMTGTKLKNPNYHTGHATRNVYLHALVAAYHGDVEKASFPLILDGEKIVDLRPDEFVSRIILYDENHNTIFHRLVKDKFPYANIVEYLPTARYMELYIPTVWWSGQALIQGSSVEGRYVKYDLKEKKIISQRPPKIR